MTVGVVVALVAALLAAAVHYQPAATRAEIPVGESAERAAARMLSKASAVAAGLERPGPWGEAITEAEANAWLARDLPRLAGRLPAGWQALGVRFHPRQVACSGIVGYGAARARWWAILEVGLPRPDEIVVTVDSAGLGLVPLPSGMVLSAIARLATEARWPAEIRLHDGIPRLHVIVSGHPPGARADRGGYHLEGLRIDEGELVFAGSTQAPPR